MQQRVVAVGVHLVAAAGPDAVQGVGGRREGRAAHHPARRVQLPSLVGAGLAEDRERCATRLGGDDGLHGVNAVFIGDERLVDHHVVERDRVDADCRGGRQRGLQECRRGKDGGGEDAVVVQEVECLDGDL